MRTLACLTVAAVLSVASISEAWAEPFAYGIAYDELFRVDLGTRRATSIGLAGNYGGQSFGQLEGMTYGPGNALYAVSDSLIQKPVVTINPSTGAASFVAPLSLGAGTGQFNSFDFGAAFTCDGRMWLSSATTRKLWRIEPARGESELAGTMAPTITGLAARGNELFGAGGRGNNSLYKIDTNTGAATLIGGFGSANSGWISSVSMNFDAQGTLWAVFNYLPPAPGSSTSVDWSDLARIDPLTGIATVLGPITGPESLRGIGMTGFALGATPCPPPDGGTGTPQAASLPVGSPWALWLLCIGVIGIVATRARRSSH